MIYLLLLIIELDCAHIIFPVLNKTSSFRSTMTDSEMCTFAHPSPGLSIHDFARGLIDTNEALSKENEALRKEIIALKAQLSASEQRLSKVESPVSLEGVSTEGVVEPCSPAIATPDEPIFAGSATQLGVPDEPVDPLNQDQTGAPAEGESGPSMDDSEDATSSPKFESDSDAGDSSRNTSDAECVDDADQELVLVFGTGSDDTHEVLPEKNIDAERVGKTDRLLKELNTLVDVDGSHGLRPTVSTGADDIEQKCPDFQTSVTVKLKNVAWDLTISNIGCYQHFLQLIDYLLGILPQAAVEEFRQTFSPEKQKVFRTREQMRAQLQWLICHKRNTRLNLEHKHFDLLRSILSDPTNLISTLGEGVSFLPWFDNGLTFTLATRALTEDRASDHHSCEAHIAWVLRCILGVPVSENDITFVDLVWSDEVNKGHRLWEVIIRRPDESLYYNWYEASFLIARMLLCGVFNTHHNFQNRFAGAQLTAPAANFTGLVNTPGLKAALPLGVHSERLTVEPPPGYKHGGPEGSYEQTFMVVLPEATLEQFNETSESLVWMLDKYAPLALVLHQMRHLTKADPHIGFENIYPSDSPADEQMARYLIPIRQRKPHQGQHKTGGNTGPAASAAAQPATRSQKPSNGKSKTGNPPSHPPAAASPAAPPAAPAAAPPAAPTAASPAPTLDSLQTSFYKLLVVDIRTPRLAKYARFAVHSGLFGTAGYCQSPLNRLAGKIIGMYGDAKPTDIDFWISLLPAGPESKENTTAFYTAVEEACECLIGHCEGYVSPSLEVCQSDMEVHFQAFPAEKGDPLAGQATLSAGQADPPAGQATKASTASPAKKASGTKQVAAASEKEPRPAKKAAPPAGQAGSVPGKKVPVKPAGDASLNQSDADDFFGC